MKEYGSIAIKSTIFGFVTAVAYCAGYKLWEDVLEDKVDDLVDYLTEKFHKE